jgi:WD40 repeat protein/predicted Ser/Thr protein kinase
MRLLSDTSGFGTVYEAYERTTPKILKVLKQQHNSNPKAVELFQQEAIVLSKFHNPGMPRVAPDGYFQYFCKDSPEPLYCIIMEKIDGPNLMQWMQQQGNQPINEQQALNWLWQLAEILHLVHQHNYFHRDIKPQNIMMRSTGEVVLVDFGTAREMTYTYLAHLGESAGVTQVSSPGYTPPEQDRGQAVPQSDFYALGRTFVYLLTGMQLTDTSICNPMTNEFHWRQYAPTISRQLADFIDRLIAPRALDRPKNTQELLDAIAQLSERVFDDHAVSRPGSNFLNRPTSAFTTAPRTLLKSRQNWLLLGVAIALSVGLTGVVGWYVSRSLGIKPVPGTIATGHTFSGHTSYVNCLIFSPDGKTLISGGADKTIRIWDVSSGKELRTLTGHTSFINFLVISPDGESLISASADKTIKIWNLATGKDIRTLTGHRSLVNRLVISPDGRELVSGGADLSIKIWDLATGRELRTLTGHTGYINALVISPDGTTLISASADRTLKLWNLTTGKVLQTLTGHNDYVNAVLMTPDGRTIISASADRTIKLWDFASSKVLRTLTGHTSYVNALVISPDGKTLVSAGADKTIKFWNLATGQELRALTGYPHPINYVAINPDWSAIATGSGDKVIKVWQLMP